MNLINLFQTERRKQKREVYCEDCRFYQSNGIGGYSCYDEFNTVPSVINKNSFTVINKPETINVNNNCKNFKVRTLLDKLCWNTA